MAVNWKEAPEGAEFYACGEYYRVRFGVAEFFSRREKAWVTSCYFVKFLTNHQTYEPRPTAQELLEDDPSSLQSSFPQVWPDDTRINNIGLNRTEDDMGHYNRNADEVFGVNLEVYNKPKTSAEFLSACLQVQTERGKQYDSGGTGERSFTAAAMAYNAVTGQDLKGSDICLILEMVKLVRQYSSPDRLHDDSVLDKVSYSALWAEELVKELGGK